MKHLCQRLIWVTVGVLLAGMITQAQEYVPELGPAFLADEVASVRLTLAQTDLDFILNPDNAYSNEEWPLSLIHI